jgi:hypothetical protein
MASMIYAPRVEFVTPQKWKARMMLSFDKSQSLALARKMFGHDLFPRKKDEGLAEAALIAFWAAREDASNSQQEEDPLS